MIIHEWIEQHKMNVVNIVRSRRGCDDLADDLASVFNNCYRIINEASGLRRRIQELEAELLTFRPNSQAPERDEYGTHIKWTGD
jgi:hypothetical protein